MTLLLNAIRATAVRTLIPCHGPWIADLDVDGDLPTAPSGISVITIGTATMRGTVDEDASGRRGDAAQARVVAGAGGWQKTVPKRHFEASSGVLSTAIFAATAAEVRETVVDTSPAIVGVSYARSEGPASRVLHGRSWYVDLAGVTIVGPRPTLPATPDIEILDWNPSTHALRFSSTSIVQPGTVFTDAKFGTLVARDVEQTFDASGARGTAWCSSSSRATAGTKLAQMLRSVAREAVADVYLRPHRYRVVTTRPDKRLVLQAVEKTSGVPDLVPCAFWPSAAGVTAELPNGAIVVVEFLDGNPAFPAITHVEAGTVPTRVTVGAGTRPVLVGTPGVPTDAWFAQVTAAVNGLAPGSITAPPPAPSPKFFSE